MAQEYPKVTTSRDDDEILEAATADEAPDQIAEARASIEETRAEMTETIDAIMYRLSPSTLIEEAKEATIEKAHEAVSDVVDNIKEKAADVMETVGNVYHAAAEHVSDAYHAVADHMGDAAHNIAEHASDAAQHVSDKIADIRAGAANDETAVPTRYDMITQKNTNIGATIVETIKLNPVPAAIAGFGLGWLLLSMQRQQKAAATNNLRQYENDLPVETLDDAAYIAPTVAYSSNFGTATNNGTIVPSGTDAPGLRDRASDIAHNIGDKASDIAQNVSGKASDIAHTVSDKASGIAQSVSDKASDLKGRAGEWAGGVRDSAGQLRDRAGDAVHNLADQTKTQASAAVDATGQFVQEQTLIAAGIALLVGVAVAYAIPATNKENQILGPQRDKLVDQGKDAAQGVANKVQSVANVALGQAQQSLGQTVDQAKQQIQQTVQQTKDTVVSEAHNQGLALAA